MEGIAALGERHGPPLRLQGFPKGFHVSLGGNPEPYTDFEGLNRWDLAGCKAFAKQFGNGGVWAVSRGIRCVSSDHKEVWVEETLSRLDFTRGRQ